MYTIELFLKKNIYWEKEKYIFFWKENKMKGGNKNVLQSGRDRYTTKKYITTWIIPLNLFFFSIINVLFKNMYNYQFMNHVIQPE